MADINKIKVSNETYDIKDTSKLPLAGGVMDQSAAIQWEPKNNLTPYIGPCTSSDDGTFLFGSLEGDTYSNGLAIGGSSKNLLWKGKRIITADGTGATGTWGISISGNASGNAGTATQFQDNATVELTGDVTGSASSKKGWSITTSLKNSGVTAGNYGPSANASPGHGSTFSVPYLTVDTKGRVTAASTKTITLPADANTHYTTGITAGATGTTSNSAVSNPFIKIKDDSTHRGQIQIKGSGATSVSSDANGVITISSTDNNTTYGVATSSALGLVKSGTDITVDSSGNVSVVDGSHNHSAGNITSGTLAVARGGTGLTASPSMLINLGSTTAASVFAASPRPGVTGTLPIANGGTGATTAAGVISNIGAMDLTSAQTASGVKTFSNGIKIGNATLSYNSTASALVLSFN